jgi:hypothetical protein
MELIRKKLLRLLPSYLFGALPLTLMCIIYEAATNPNGIQSLGGGAGVAIQFVLECFTIGSWNPALLFWTRNRPLWFISELLIYQQSVLPAVAGKAIHANALGNDCLLFDVKNGFPSDYLGCAAVHLSNSLLAILPHHASLDCDSIVLAIYWSYSE